MQPPQRSGAVRPESPPLTASWRFRVASAYLLLTFLIVYLTQFTEAGPVYPVLPFRTRGGDFRILFDSAVRFAVGDTLGQGFNKPPLLAAVLTPLTLLPYSHALLLFQLLIVLTPPLAVVAITRSTGQPVSVAVVIAATVVGSYPFAFLLDRGNIDGIVYCFALCAFLLQGRGLTLFAVLCFAAAAGLNPNILAAAPAFAVRGAYRRTAVTALLAALITTLLFSLTPHYSMVWLDTIAARATLTGWQLENGSLFRLADALGLSGVAGWGLAAALTLPLVVGLLAVGTRRTLGGADRFLLAFPLCQVYPRVAFVYGYVLFPLMLLRYCRNDQTAGWAVRLECAASSVGITGLLLALVPVGFLVNANLAAPYVSWLPSLGLALILLANGFLIWLTAPVVEDRWARGTPFGEAIASGALVVLCAAAVLITVRDSRRPVSPRAALVDQVPLRWPDANPRPPFGIAEIEQEWGIVHLNTNLMGEPLRVAGATYQQGIATHARGHLLALLPPQSKRLSGLVGIDDASLGSARGVVFVIRDGARELFRSPEMFSDTPAVPFSVPVAGLATIELLVLNVGAVNYFNHADWLNLKIE